MKKFFVSLIFLFVSCILAISETPSYNIEEYTIHTGTKFVYFEVNDIIYILDPLEKTYAIATEIFPIHVEDCIGKIIITKPFFDGILNYTIYLKQGDEVKFMLKSSDITGAGTVKQVLFNELVFLGDVFDPGK